MDLREPTEEAVRWQSLTVEEKALQLYENQIQLLDTFLARNAISRQQYEKSLRALRTLQHH